SIVARFKKFFNNFLKIYYINKKHRKKCCGVPNCLFILFPLKHRLSFFGKSCKGFYSIFRWDNDFVRLPFNLQPSLQINTHTMLYSKFSLLKSKRTVIKHLFGKFKTIMQEIILFGHFSKNAICKRFFRSNPLGCKD